MVMRTECCCGKCGLKKWALEYEYKKKVRDEEKKIALLHCPRNVTTLKVEGVAFRLGLNLTHCYLEKEKPFCNREKRLLSLLAASSSSSFELYMSYSYVRRTTTRLT